MDIKQLLKNLSRGLWQDELDRLDTLRAEEQQYLTTIVYNEELEKELEQIETLLKNVTRELEYKNKLFLGNEKPHHKGWMIHDPNYRTIDNLKVPVNTFITINDRDLRRVLINKGFHKLEFEVLIWKLEQWCRDYIKYVLDTDSEGRTIENFRSASYTFKDRQGDCDNYAIFFQTCMHMLGYGDKSVVIVNNVELGSMFKGGHAYVKVLINNEWTIVDPTNPRKFRKDDWIYDIIHPQLNWFFNYWGIYKIKDNKVIGNE